MRLLVSVRDASEACEALAGGADIIDAKDPARGALGAVAPAALHAIVAEVDGARPVSAALGDAVDDVQVMHAAREAAAARVAYVKLGFAGTPDPARVVTLLSAAVRGAEMVSTSVGVIAVAYADAECAESVAPLQIIEAAERAGAVGVLLDTAGKDRGALFDLVRDDAVRAWVHAAHQAGLVAALAGRLTDSTLATARALDADIAGVRGTACEGGGRLASISRERVADLARVVARRRAGVWAPQQRWRRAVGDELGGRLTPPAALP
jgi:uncharacterized protein (UPF0264 family)